MWGKKPLFGKDPFGPKLKYRIIYTILLVAVFRGLAAIPLINADEKTLNKILAENPIIGVVDLFAGGEVLSHFSIVAAGIFPYLVALAFANTAVFVLPQLRDLKAGEVGKKRIEKYAKWAAIPIALLFAWGLSQLLSQEIGLFPYNLHLFIAGKFLGSLTIMGLITLGSVCSTWITDAITNVGVYKGEGVLLLVGSCLILGKQFVVLLRGWPYSAETVQRFAVIGIGALAAIALSVFLVKAIRRVKVATTRTAGTRVRFSPELPLRFNSGGILPVSSSIGLLFLIHVAQDFLSLHAGGPIAAVALSIGGWATSSNNWYWVAYALLVVGFTYICNFSLLNQPFADEEISIAEQMKRNLIWIPGVRPGAQTEAYLSQIMLRITPVGALALATLSAGIPFVTLRLTQQDVSAFVVSVFVFVQTLDGLLYSLSGYKALEKYDGLLKAHKRRSPSISWPWRRKL